MLTAEEESRLKLHTKDAREMLKRAKALMPFVFAELELLDLELENAADVLRGAQERREKGKGPKATGATI